MRHRIDDGKGNRNEKNDPQWKNINNSDMILTQQRFMKFILGIECRIA